MNKKIILISGGMRTGKDYLALKLKALFENDGRITSIDSLATPLKHIIADTFGITVDQLNTFKNEPADYGVEIKAYPNNQRPVVIEYISWRKILQVFGTEAMKKYFTSTVWADLLVKKIHSTNASVFIVPDFRFHEEYEAIAKVFGSNLTTIKIAVDNDTINYCNEESIHSSEISLNNFTCDYIFQNTRDSDIFSERLLDLYKELNACK